MYVTFTFYIRIYLCYFGCKNIAFSQILEQKYHSRAMHYVLLGTLLCLPHSLCPRVMPNFVWGRLENILIWYITGSSDIKSYLFLLCCAFTKIFSSGPQTRVGITLGHREWDGHNSVLARIAQELANYILWAKFWWPPVFVNKVLLGTDMLICLHIFLTLFVILHSWVLQQRIACKDENIHSMALYGKSFLTSALG